MQKLKDSYKSEAALLTSNAKIKEKQITEAHAAEIHTFESTVDKNKAKILELEKSIQTINGKLKVFYETHRDDQGTIGNSPKPVNDSTYADLVVNHAQKLSTDNQWLVEKLEEFGKENEDLKKNPVFNEKAKADIMSEARNVKGLIDSFQKNYSDLLVINVVSRLLIIKHLFCYYKNIE